AGALRIQALPPNFKGPNQPPALGQPGLNLEITPHPGLTWQHVIDVRIEKALDEHGQVLIQQNANPQSNSSNEIVVWNQPGRALIVMDSSGSVPVLSTRQMPVRLKPGSKPSKMLKELRGVVAAQVTTPAEPLIMVDNVLQSTGRTVKGDKGGSI